MDVQQLALKIQLIYSVGKELGGQVSILTGLLGGGAFRNNRPLILLLHLLLSSGQATVFHNTIFKTFCSLTPAQIEAAIERKAEEMLACLRKDDPTTVAAALAIIVGWALCSADNDADIRDTDRKRRRGDDGTYWDQKRTKRT